MNIQKSLNLTNIFPLKKILLLSGLIISSFLSFSQSNPFPSKATRGNVNTLDSAAGGVTSGIGFINKTYTDTASANLSLRFKTYPGSQIFTTSDNKFWLRNAAANQWVQVGGGVSVAACGDLVGGIVSYDTLLIFNVSQADRYCINDQNYSSAGGQITLDPADPSLPRIDIIGFDTSGAVIKITGVPASDPQAPQVDASSQYFLTTVLVNAGATSPSEVHKTILYDENTGSEWTGSGTGVTVDFNYSTSPSNVYHLTKSANVGTLTNNDVVGFTGAAETLSQYNLLNFYLKLKTIISGASNISVTLLSGGTPYTSPLVLTSAHGFVKNNSTSFQNISIPLSQFPPISDASIIDGLRITMSGITFTGYYIDYINLQGGIANNTGNGNYLTDVYASNDSLYKVKNGIPIFWYKVNASGGSTDTTVAKFPLYVKVTSGQKDSLGAYGIDSSFQNAVVVNDSTLRLYRFNGDSSDFSLPSGIKTIQAGSNITVDNTDPLNPVVSSTGGGGGSTEYILQGYGLKVDSSGRVYTVGVDTSLIKTVADAQADSLVLATAINSKQAAFGSQTAWHVYGNHTSGSAAPTFGKMNVNSIDATGTPGSGNFLRGDGSWVAGALSPWLYNGNKIYYNTDNVGINNSNPASKLEITDNAITNAANNTSGVTLSNYTVAPNGTTLKYAPSIVGIAGGYNTTTSQGRTQVGRVSWRPYQQLTSNNTTGAWVMEISQDSGATFSDVAIFQKTFNQPQVQIGGVAISNNSISGLASSSLGAATVSTITSSASTSNSSTSNYTKTGTFTANTGSGYTYNGMRIAETVNASAGTGHIYRSIFLDPTLTATTGTEVRTLEVTRGNVVLNSSAGSTVIGGTTADASAKLDVQSTTQGALMPRMTTTERTAITSPAEGLMVYDLTLHKLYVYDGTTWQAAW